MSDETDAKQAPAGNSGSSTSEQHIGGTMASNTVSIRRHVITFLAGFSSAFVLCIAIVAYVSPRGAENKKLKNILGMCANTYEADISNRHQEIVRRLTYLQQKQMEEFEPRSKKVEQLCAKARASETSDEAHADLCFRTAIRYDNGTQDTLGQYIKWREGYVMRALNTTNIPQAYSIFRSLVSTADSSLENGGPEVVLQYQTYYTSLNQLAKKIDDRVDALETAQRQLILKTIASITNTAFDTERYSYYTNAANVLSSLAPITTNVEDLLLDSIDVADSYIDAAASCKGSDIAGLTAPSSDIPGVASIWMRHALPLLTNKNTSVTARDAALKTVKTFLQQTATIQPAVTTWYAQVSALEQKLQIDTWRNMADLVLHETNDPTLASSLAQNLVSQGSRLADPGVSSDLNKLKTLVVQYRVSNIIAQYKKLEESTATDSAKRQVRSGIESQICQAMMDVDATADVDAYSELTTKLKALSDLDAEYDKKVQVEQLTDRNAQEKRFLAFCSKNIADAKKYYAEAYTMSKEMWRMEGNKDVQRKLYKTLQTLYEIHTGSLQAVDPGYYAQWAACEEDIKKMYQPAHNGGVTAAEIYKDTPKKRVQDF